MYFQRQEQWKNAKAEAEAGLIQCSMRDPVPKWTYKRNYMKHFSETMERSVVSLNVSGVFCFVRI